MDVDVENLIGLALMDNIGIWELAAVNVAKNAVLVEPLRILILASAAVEMVIVLYLLPLVKATPYGTPVNANASLNAFLLLPVPQGRPGTS